MQSIRDPLVGEIVSLSCRLVRCAAITTGPTVNDGGIQEAYSLITGILEDAGLNVVRFDKGGRYPAVYCDAGPPDSAPRGELLLSGHYDVVLPQSEAQLMPEVDGDWIRGRGAADMLTVVATMVLFMRDLARKGREAPPVGLLLVGNEETGEADPWGTPFVLGEMKKRWGYAPTTMIAGERTGEGAVVAGLVEPRNRGVFRAHLEASGAAAHLGLTTQMTPIARLFAVHRAIEEALGPQPAQPWHTQFQVCYINAGDKTNFNITTTHAEAGFELRPADPRHNVLAREVIARVATEIGVEVTWLLDVPPVFTAPGDPRLQRVLRAAAEATGVPADKLLGPGKTAGTQARFAPPGCAALVWGEAGVGPHAAHEAHYIPSIRPYYDALWLLAGGEGASPG